VQSQSQSQSQRVARRLPLVASTAHDVTLCGRPPASALRSLSRLYAPSLCQPLSTIHTRTLGLPTPDAEAIMDAFLPFEVNTEALNGKDW
jgi:hypothetical protein